MDLARRMVVHSESNSSAVDVERMRTRIYGQLYGRRYVCLPFHSNFTRDNLLLCGADMMKHTEVVVLAYSLERTTRTTRTRRRIVAVCRSKGTASPALELVRVISYLRARELKI